MSADIELSQRIASMRSHSEAAGMLGQHCLESAYMACAAMLLDAAVEDGVVLDLDTLGDCFGVEL